MKKHHSKVHAPRGRITSGRGHVDLGGVQLPGTWPVLLVTIKNCRDGWKQFLFFCRKYGLVFKIAGEKEEVTPARRKGWQVTYEVKGGPALEELTDKWFVVDWHYPLNVGAPHFNSSTSRR